MPSGKVLVRYVDGTSVLVANMTNEPFKTGRGFILSAILNTRRIGHWLKRRDTTSSSAKVPKGPA